MSAQLFFKKVSVFVVVAGTFMLSSSGAHAVNSVWTGETSNDMTDALGNWNPPPTQALNTGSFVGDAGAINNPHLASGILYADGLVFASGGWNITGGGTLSLGMVGLNAYQGPASLVNDGTINIYTNIEARAATQNWGIASADTAAAVMNIYGNLSGEGNITIAGRGAINLWGDNSAYSGTLTVGGLLGINHANALGSSELKLQGGRLTTSNLVTTVTNNVLVTGNNVTYNLGLAAQSVGTDGTITSITDPRLNTNTLILAGNVNLVGAVNTTFYVHSGTLVISGSLSGNGFSKGNYTGDGSLVLAGNNLGLTGTFNYSPGGAQPGFTPGSLSLNHEYALGSVSQIEFSSNATRLDNTSGTAIHLNTSAPILMRYGITFLGSNDLSLGNGLMTVGNPGNQNNFYVNDKTLTIASMNNQQEAGRTYYINKYGPGGNLIVSGSVDWTQMYLTVREGLFAVRGDTVYSGTISVNAGQYAGHGTITSGLLWGNSGGTSAGLAAYGGDLTVNLGGSGSTYNWGGGLFGGNQTLLLGHALSDGMVDIQNGVNLSSAGARIVEVVSGSGATKIDARFSGSIIGTDNRANLMKTGRGVLEIAGNTSYTGTTTVAEGTLLLSGTANGQRPYNVSAGATLGGHGTIILSGADVNVSGVLDVSGGGVLDDLGTLTLNLGTGTLNLSAAQGLGFILGADGDNDQIKLLGNTKFLWNNALTLGDFNFTLGSGFTGDGTYELIVSDSTLLPSFTDLTGTLGGGAYDATLSLLNNSALVLTVTAIPEPSALALMLGGAALLLVLRRRSTK